MSEQWAAVLSEVPGVITDSNGNMAGDDADAARASWLSAASAGAIITGFTNHGLQQAETRDGGLGVSDSAIEDAVANPLKTVVQPGGTVKYVGTDATVVLNSDGQVVTTWANSSAGVRNPIQVPPEPPASDGGKGPL